MVQPLANFLDRVILTANPNLDIAIRQVDRVAAQM